MQHLCSDELFQVSYFLPLRDLKAFSMIRREFFSIYQQLENSPDFWMFRYLEFINLRIDLYNNLIEESEEMRGRISHQCKERKNRGGGLGIFVLNQKLSNGIVRGMNLKYGTLDVGWKWCTDERYRCYGKPLLPRFFLKLLNRRRERLLIKLEKLQNLKRNNWKMNEKRAILNKEQFINIVNYEKFEIVKLFLFYVEQLVPHYGNFIIQCVQELKISEFNYEIEPSLLYALCIYIDFRKSLFETFRQRLSNIVEKRNRYSIRIRTPECGYERYD